MTRWHDAIPFDPELTDSERERAIRLSDEELARIDASLLSHATTRFAKIAMVVSKAMAELQAELPGVVDLFYAQRIRSLIGRGLLDVQGDPRRMRFAEVKRRSHAKAPSE